MKIIGASMVDTLDTFLHAGYISAYPRSLESSAYPPGSEYTTAETAVQLNMHDALELGNAPLTDAGVLDATTAAVANGGSSELIIGALTLTGLFALYYLIRKSAAVRALRPAFGVAVLSLLLTATPHCKDGDNDAQSNNPSLEGDDALPTVPPWEGETVQGYVQPEEATLALLHGIIRPAIVNIGQRVETLANIQNEVDLPTTTPTEGEQYALRMYGLDGWGNPFILENTQLKDVDESPYWGYTVTSGGPDATVGTDDDISATFEQNINDNWGFATDPVYYLVEDGDSIAVLFHRWDDEMFKYRDEAGAKKLTGGNRFDIIAADDLSDAQNDAIQIAFEAVKTDAQDRSPLVLQVFK